MLLAYIDEIGEPGAFVARDHDRFNTSPAFGYAGFILPDDQARPFGSVFNQNKRSLFAQDMENAPHAGRWEKKGASVFRRDTAERFPQYLRVFDWLVKEIRRLDGALFYYADEKPLGTPKQTGLDVSGRETAAMREALNRIARHADGRGSNVMVIIDQVNEKTRAERLPAMYGHILGRANDYPEMRRIIEPPMHVDSVLSSNIQFADWVAACVSRAIDYQLISDSPYTWVTDRKALPSVRGAFTHESKVHLWHRSVPDVNHSDVFKSQRVLHPKPSGHLVSSGVDPAIWRRMKGAAERAQS
ncbi:MULTISPECIES: DUF3800 domain-containing protein [unclassified Leifsonia]|uniref:DUF3800 domain-containing protein n=1 Tax=unclassified Leifsonia TaxID=2663824 RepID=UPI00037CAA7A|nr:MULTISPECIES: DUF3800 domain-containing protein [unclassified Leifsonia]TDQ01918.1 uncharacterized protein DUF3800 [Leifsonia sp. 115AMFTsu3.1]